MIENSNEASDRVESLRNHDWSEFLIDSKLENQMKWNRWSTNILCVDKLHTRSLICMLSSTMRELYSRASLHDIWYSYLSTYKLMGDRTRDASFECIYKVVAIYKNYTRLHRSEWRDILTGYGMAFSVSNAMSVEFCFWAIPDRDLEGHFFLHLLPSWKLCFDECSCLRRFCN